MFDRILLSGWRLVIIALIFVLGCGATFLFYQGILELMSVQWRSGALSIAIGAGLGTSVYWLAKNRNDLVYG